MEKDCPNVRAHRICTNFNGLFHEFRQELRKLKPMNSRSGQAAGCGMACA
jgi:hypothetical protein